jgi:predicted MFS family arabinose efflux permease
MKLKFLAPLRIRDFAFLWWGLTISLIGDGIFFIALPFLVFSVSESPIAYTLALIAWTLPLVAFLLVGGVLSDRFERRRMLMLGNALQGVAIALIGVLAILGVIELWHIIVLAAAYGIGEAIFGPAFGAIVPDIVPQNLLVEANSLDNLSRPFALRVAGPAAGGLIVHLFGTGRAMLIDAVTFAAAGVAFMLIRTRRGAASGSSEGVVWSDVKAGFRFVRAHAWLWGGLLSAGVGLLFFYGPWMALVPFRVTHALNGNEGDLAIVLAVGGIGAVLASILVGQRRLPRRFMTTMYLSMSGGTLMLVGFGFASTTWQAVIASFVMQAFFTTGIIIWNSTMHRLVPGNLLGRVSALDWLVSTSLIPVSLAFAGPIAQLLGTRMTLVGAGLLGCALVLTFLLLPGTRDPERTPRAAGVTVHQQ